MGRLVDVVVVDEGGVVEQLHGRRERGGAQRLLPGTDSRGELYQLWPQAFAARFHEAAHGQRHRVGVDQELPGDLHFHEVREFGVVSDG